MLTIQFEIPDEVATFIRDELGAEPKTYFQNEFIGKLVSQYEKAINTSEKTKMNEVVEAKMVKVKNEMKVVISASEKKRK